MRADGTSHDTTGEKAARPIRNKLAAFRLRRQPIIEFRLITQRNFEESGNRAF